MLNIVPEQNEHEHTLTSSQIKNWSYTILSLHKLQLPGFKGKLPSKPKSISDILAWLEDNRSNTVRSIRLRKSVQFALPTVLYVLGGAWLSTIFSLLTVGIYFVPFALFIVRHLLIQSKQRNQFERLIDATHTSELQTQLFALQNSALTSPDQTPPSFSNEEGLLFSYMIQKDGAESEYHIISFRSATEELFEPSVAYLSLIAKRCLPKAEAPVVFKATEDIYHLLYTHEHDGPFKAPPPTPVDPNDLLEDLWLIVHHTHPTQSDTVQS